MPKTSEINYYESRGGYYTWIAGKQTRLAKGPKDEPSGPTYRQALKAFSEAMEMAAVGKPDASLTLKAVFEVYFRDRAPDLRPKTIAIRQLAARQFCARFPGLAASDLTGDHIRTFIAEGRIKGAGTAKSTPWGETTAAIKYHSLRIMLKWAVDEEYMTGEALKRKHRLKLRSRARDKVITPEEHERVLTHFDRDTYRWFTGVVIALENTGARLGEILSARVRDWQDSLGALVYYSDRSRRADDFRHKSAARKDRIILFTGRALEMVRFLIKDRPGDAPIWHNRRGRAFDPRCATQYFVRAQRATGLKHLTAHAYRHTFATRWLQRDGNIDALAECLGDTPETIRQTYSHLLKDPASLRAKLESVMRPCTEIRP